MPDSYSALLIVESELHGVRIDSFLIKHFRNYTSWRMQRIVAAGHVTINDELASPTQRVFVGNQVKVGLIEPPDKLLEAETVTFRILYRDQWMLVVDKPAGVISHPSGDYQTGTLANGVQAYLDTLTPRRGLVRPGIVHRLDRQTSGLMVVATHHRSHAELSDAFEAGRVSKEYLAIVEGRMLNDEGMIDLPIGRSRTGSRVLMSARGDAVDARVAKTKYNVEQRFAEHTLVRAKPMTGRNHQIRVHFAQIGHPLVGDEFYDIKGSYKTQGDEFGSADTQSESLHFLAQGRHALHATSLAFAHPITGIWLSFSSPLPTDMRRLADTMKVERSPNLIPITNEAPYPDDVKT
ncbi:MAG: RluA family pseudouridine synthase [Planctomycetaceae bacterium]|nr:RluA family pseudouridine synthase [Planctomycetaceae bacterium]